MSEFDCPIHYGSCLLRGRLDPQNLPQVYMDFRNVGLQSLIEFEDVAHSRRVREFHREFLLTGIVFPEIWGNEIRVTFDLNGVSHSMTTSRFSELMRIPSAENDFKFYTNSFVFTYDELYEGGENMDEVLAEIVKPNKISRCIRRRTVTVEDLQERLRIHYRIIRENVTCRDMNFRMSGQTIPENVLVIEALLMYWILKGKRVDMGFLMACICQQTRVVYPNAPLPYGMRLTSLFRNLNAIPSEEHDPAVIVPRMPLI